MTRLTFNERAAQRDAAQKAGGAAAEAGGKKKMKKRKELPRPTSPAKRPRTTEGVITLDLGEERDILPPSHLQISDFHDVEQTMEEMFGSSALRPPPSQPSILYNDPTGISASIAQHIHLDRDMQIHRCLDSSKLVDNFLQSHFQSAQILQVLHERIQGYSTELSHLQLENQTLIQKVPTLESEKQKLSEQVGTLNQNVSILKEDAEVQLRGFEAQRKQLEETTAKLKQLEETVEARVAEASRQSLLDYQASDEFKQIKAQAIRDFKKSEDGLYWLDTRGLEYFTQGFSRCKLQIQNSEYVSKDMPEDYLKMGLEMEGEYEVPPHVDSEDEGDEGAGEESAIEASNAGVNPLH